ncbi:MAG: 5-formyltetrahydrofolate cyclo-ligase, partial [Alphaproteobacteria bacterium]
MPRSAADRHAAPDTSKQDVRARAKRRRRAAAADAARAGAGERLRERFLAGIPLTPGTVVAAYWPVGDEIDVRPLLHALHERGHLCVLPVVVGPRPL